MTKTVNDRGFSAIREVLEASEDKERIRVLEAQVEQLKRRPPEAISSRMLITRLDASGQADVVDEEGHEYTIKLKALPEDDWDVFMSRLAGAMISLSRVFVTVESRFEVTYVDHVERGDGV